MLLVGSLSLLSCDDEPKIDPCVYLGDGIGHCYPLNSTEKPEYERPILPGDFCVTPSEYGTISKHHKYLHKELGRK